MNEIKCINKDPRNDIYNRITHIGGVNSKGGTWKITQQQAIEYIKSGKYNFYVNVGGDKVDVIVSKSKFGNEYIRTKSDGEEPNNLLSLMECKN